MKDPVFKRLLLVLLLTVAAGCEVTAEKIELWKGTQNGPQKLSAALVDPGLAVDLRAKAALALVEINAWDIFRESFQKMEKADAEKVVDAVAPILAKMVESAPAGADKISKLQMDAKDALFMLLDYASAGGRAAVEKPLIDWCTTDYNTRAMAGQFKINIMVKKIGARAGEALVPLLTLDQLAIQYIADLIVELKDDGVAQKASAQIAKVLKASVGKIQEIHLVAAATIGGNPVADALIGFATDPKLDAALQRFALRALSQAVDKKRVQLDDARMARLLALAENPDTDKFQREETFYLVAQAGRPADVPRIMRLLADKDSFFRAVALRCLLRTDPETHLEPALAEIARLGLTTSAEDVNEVISRVDSFPKLLPKARGLVESKNPFVRAVAVYVLGDIGQASDKAILEKLAADKTRLPKGFEDATIGAAAKKGIEKISMKRGV
ncbi:MAG: hypothetical protein PHU25_06995 [Deltaproteobacteria bacterium]|nr:hypothetical protein [Deltaproteobacteria bacterium]